MEAIKRKPGRPRGSKNVKTEYVPPSVPLTKTSFSPPSVPLHRADRVIDPMRLVDDQLRLLSWAQEVMSTGMERSVDGTYKNLDAADVRRLSDMSNAIARILEAMKRSTDLAEELSRRMSAEQLLEAAIGKIEGQDIKTLNYAIRRLRAYREKIAPVTTNDMLDVNFGKAFATAADAISSLEDE